MAITRTHKELAKVTLSEATQVGGEVTIFANDANTRRFPLNVQVLAEYVDDITASVVSGGHKFPLDVGINGAENQETPDCVDRGQSIVLSSSAFPVSYFDIQYVVEYSAGNQGQGKISLVNGEVDPGASTLVSQALVDGFDAGNALRYRHASTGHIIEIRFDNNSDTQLYVADETGASIYTETTSYRPKVFDGRDKVYWVGASGVLRQYDIPTNAVTSKGQDTNNNSPTTYPLIGYVYDWTGDDDPGVFSFEGGDSNGALTYYGDLNGAGSAVYLGNESAAQSSLGFSLYASHVDTVCGEKISANVVRLVLGDVDGSNERLYEVQLDLTDNSFTLLSTHLMNAGQSDHQINSSLWAHGHAFFVQDRKVYYNYYNNSTDFGLAKLDLVTGETKKLVGLETTEALDGDGAWVLPGFITDRAAIDYSIVPSVTLRVTGIEEVETA